MRIGALSSLASQFPTAEVEYRDMLSWRYRFKGSGSSGVDCLGVVLEVFRRAGLKLLDPRTGAITVEEFQEYFEPVTGPPWELYDVFDQERHTGAHGTGVIVRHGTVLTARAKANVFTLPVRRIARISNIEWYRVRQDLLPT